MQAYQTGVAALRLALKDVTVEGAESLVDQIQEVAVRFQGVSGGLSLVSIHYSFAVLTRVFCLSPAVRCSRRREPDFSGRGHFRCVVYHNTRCIVS